MHKCCRPEAPLVDWSRRTYPVCRPASQVRDFSVGPYELSCMRSPGWEYDRSVVKGVEPAQFTT